MGWTANLLLLLLLFIINMITIIIITVIDIIIIIVIVTGARFQASWGESVGCLSWLVGIWS